MPVFILLSGFALVYSILVLTDVIMPDKDILFTIYMLSYSSYGRRYRYYRKSDHFYTARDYKFVYSMEFDKEFEKDYFLGINSFDLILWECIIGSAVWFLIFFVPFIIRLFTPQIIMEYDDFGVYIYRTGKPVTLLRYKEIWSTYSEGDFDNVEFCYYRGFYRVRNISVRNPFWGIFKTGSIRIEVPDGFINLGGIYNVKKVEKELKRMVKIKRQEFLDEMEENIKENQRQRKLEALVKHKPKP